MKEYSDIAEIRHEYKAKKKQLEKYNNFIDRHQLLIVVGILLLCLACMFGTIDMSSGALRDGDSTKITGIASLALLLVAIVMAFITGSRKSAKAKIEKQLTTLKDEVIIFQKHSKDHDDISRDELGLWRDIGKENNTNSHHKVIGASVIVTVLAILAAPFVISQFTNSNEAKNQAAVQQGRQVQASQAQCLNSAYTSYETAWKAADKDGDGSVSYRDGATDITTSYFDSVIDCYRTHKTADSSGYITDYQTKRQQEVDKYTTWLKSSKQPTYTQTPSSSYSSGMNCTSTSIGSSTYTSCY